MVEKTGGTLQYKSGFMALAKVHHGAFSRRTHTLVSCSTTVRDGCRRAKLLRCVRFNDCAKVALFPSVKDFAWTGSSSYHLREKKNITVIRYGGDDMFPLG